MNLVALWDTGCTDTHISQRIVDALKLEQYGIGRAANMVGYTVNNSYLVDIQLPFHRIIKNYEVYAGPLPGIDVIIGMDIIKYCDFSISNDGKGYCTCSIRYPSQGVIDYTEE